MDQEDPPRTYSEKLVIRVDRHSTWTDHKGEEEVNITHHPRLSFEIEKALVDLGYTDVQVLTPFQKLSAEEVRKRHTPEVNARVLATPIEIVDGSEYKALPHTPHPRYVPEKST